jgi:hypothetical protein
MGEPVAEELFERPERFPGLPPLRAHERLLRVWVCPSFTPWTSWSVYRSGAARQVRRVMLVPGALEGVAPWGADGFAPASEVDAVVAALEAMELAPFVSVATLGIDGTTYGVERGGHWLSARLAWWERPPTAWAPLAAWHERARAFLDQHVPEHRDPRTGR